MQQPSRLFTTSALQIAVLVLASAGLLVLAAVMLRHSLASTPAAEAGGESFDSSARAPLLWQDFDVADGVPARLLGWESAGTGAIVVQSSALRLDPEVEPPGNSGTIRIVRDLGVRPEVVEVTIDPGKGAAALEIRRSHHGHYRIRWNKAAGQFEMDQVTTASSPASVRLTSLPMPVDADGDGQTAYDLRVIDTGDDIIARIRGYERELVASSSPDFTNLHRDATSLSLRFDPNEPAGGFRSIRVWETLEQFQAAQQDAAMVGTFEKSRHSAVRYTGTHDRTYIAWITPWGSLYIRWFDHEADTWGPPALIDHLAQRVGRWARDDHNYPTIVVADDGTLSVFAAVHQGGGPAFWQWRSSEPESVTSFDPPYAFGNDHLTAPSNAGYPTPFRVGNGDLVLFYRGDGGSTTGNWYVTRSTDNGETWSKRSPFGEADDGIYAFLEQNPEDPDHLVCFVYLSSRTEPNRHDVYYLETRDGGHRWAGAGGNPIATPADEVAMDPVFLTGEHQCRVMGVGFRNGKGAALIAYRSDPLGEYRYCWWNGQAWETARITGTQTWWDGNDESELPGGGDLHPKDPDEMVLSLPVGDVFELQRWRTHDGGRTWEKVQELTNNSSRDNARPVYVKNLHPELPFIWYHGEYRGNKGFNHAWDGYDAGQVRAWVKEDE